MLDNFFTTLNGSQFDVGDSWFQDIAHDNGGGAFGLDWAEGLPPNLEGSTTSLSQPPILSLNSAKAPNSLMGGLGPDSDILAAASMLYGHGGSGINFPTQHLFPDGAMPEMAAPHLGQHRIKQEQTHRPLGNTGHGNSRHFSIQPQHTSVFNPEEPTMPAEPQKTIALRWGSDARFVDHGYRRPDDMANIEETTQSLLDTMKCLEPQTSTTNTRASSPVRVFGFSRNGDGRNSNGKNSAGPSEEVNRGDGDNGLASRKRLKMKREEEEEDFDDSSTPPRLKRPKSSSGGRLKRGSSESASKKHKIQQNSKTARENLSEEQKRTNHILSEQKRRNLIKHGFDELCSLVPDLRGGGFSKSAMLLQAADYLEEVLKGNNVLRQQLAQIKGGVNGFVIPR
jgi:Helix-loop-helix DNA-binding domain